MGQAVCNGHLEPHVRGGKEGWVPEGIKAICFLGGHRAFAPSYQPSTWKSQRDHTQPDPDISSVMSWTRAVMSKPASKRWHALQCQVSLCPNVDYFLS